VEETVQTTTEAFSEFVKVVEPRLLQALVVSTGREVGREATADALVYAWEHWDRVSVMDNAAGYLYRVGRSCAKKYRNRVLPLPLEIGNPEPWIEPGLGGAFRGLSERQRSAVLLVEGFDWTYQEVADLMGLSRSSVQRHVERGMTKLRTALEVQNAV
jgi:DNA-directed RNA polymerase specialized sigma24 family protein